MAVLRHCVMLPVAHVREEEEEEAWDERGCLGTVCPPCWNAWPEHPESSVWPQVTTGLSLLPPPSPGIPLKAWQPLSRLGVGVLQKDLHGCLLREGTALLGAGHPRALCFFHPPQDQGDCPAFPSPDSRSQALLLAQASCGNRFW